MKIQAILSKFLGDDYLDTPDDDDDDFEKEYQRRESEIKRQNREKEIDETISRIKDEADEDKTETDLTAEDIDKTMKGSTKISELHKIFKVPYIEDGVLWEPYVDAEEKECVRISTGHRFSKVIFEDNSNDKGLQILFQILLYIGAKSELSVEKNLQDMDMDKVAKVLSEFRTDLSEKLAKFCRKNEDKLPPHSGDD